jgi:hypothetical protein
MILWGKSALLDITIPASIVAFDRTFYPVGFLPTERDRPRKTINDRIVGIASEN